MKTEWAQADSDRSGSLELAEVLKLCDKLNMHMQKSTLVEQFKVSSRTMHILFLTALQKADKDGNGSLCFTEFTEFIRDMRLQKVHEYSICICTYSWHIFSLQWQHITEIFEKFAGPKGHMTVSEFVRFMFEYQQVCATI